MKLSQRLNSIVKMIKLHSKVADIGTDHGYIPVYLYLNGISDYIIASDVKSASLNKAIDVIKKHNLSENIIVRLGDGLSVLRPNEVDTAVIAGMGGILISDILEKDKSIASTVERFILQPMTASDHLRRYIYENGYLIVDEDLVFEKGKFFEIIAVEHGKGNVHDEIFYEIGEKLFQKRHPLLKDYISYKIGKLKKIFDEVSKSNESDLLKEDILNKIKKYEVLLYESEMPDNSWND
ncbi:SAM-dependent methyltransferase [Thermoanaerobacterium sp. PSU-2]|uniref:tRNA (adenine(22)-N(1))-methyltransferase n=1 Tax=Thermoanaerobacterium sp. PSU-2 TaxID=1930849 RepID=UPI000A157E32|nr:class I SAM-dependent methyltransferase [Thermoanaerobacterium sp. PSU-2]ORX24346.1 SAM-dependent methyltransferase [Thermoanaerobacterium sp. PSU-2]